MPSLSERLLEVQARIAAASQGRSDITLIAVSKTKPIELLLEAYQAGQRVFGENKVQEARDKRPLLPPDAQIHLIGPLQTNKAKYCPTLFSTIHSLDSLKLAEELERRCAAQVTQLKVLIQMNLTGEDTKSGISNRDELKLLQDRLQTMPHLEPIGLMTIGDPDHGEAETRNTFARLRKILEQEQARIKNPAFKELSMGMSDDFEWALQEGATMVRIGSAIFGSR